MKRAMVIVVSMLCGTTCLPVPALALCALCRQALASGGSAGLVKGFYWSIVLIAGVPLLIMGAVATVAWRHRRLRYIAERPETARGAIDVSGI